MTSIDQFESAFRSAAKEVFAYERVEIATVLVVTDLDAAEVAAFAERVRSFLRALAPEDAGGPAWRVVAGDEYRTVRDLLDLVEDAAPDLVCTYRHLHSEGWRWPYTLGDHVEVLTQATAAAVLVAPHPRAGRAAAHALEDTRSVMAMTDHLTGDHRLVNYAARFTEPGGTLRLTHVEDEASFDRVIDAISKIPEIDTDTARAEILAQLLKEPRDYVRSCRSVLEREGLELKVEEIVTLGHRLAEYRALIEAHAIDLLVLNTKDEDQLAMHGLAYPLAVELRQIPLLML